MDKTGYKKDTGIFVGVMERSNSFLVATQDGICASAHVMRLPDDQAYDTEMLSQIKVSMYEYLHGGVLQPPALVTAQGSISRWCQLVVGISPDGFGLRRTT